MKENRKNNIIKNIEKGDTMEKGKIFSENWIENDITIEEIETPLNEEIIQYIENNLPQSINDSLEKAIAIYILLGDIVSYDVRYIKEKDPTILEKINNITLQNNQITCRQWALIYHKLLNYYHIQSNLYGEGHLSVILPVNNSIIKTDGFEFNQEKREYDVERIKFGIKIKDFKVMETASQNEQDKKNKQNLLEEKIEKVYKSLNRKVITEEEWHKKLKRISNHLKKFSRGVNKTEAKKRIALLNWFLNLPLGKDANMERYQYITSYLHFLFDDFPFTAVKTTSLYEETENNIKLLKAIKITDENNNPHYYLERQNKFEEYSKEQIKELMDSNILIPRHAMQKEQFFGIRKKNKYLTKLLFKGKKK